MQKHYSVEAKRKKYITDKEKGDETRLELRTSYEEVRVRLCVFAHTLKYCEVKSKSHL